MRAGLSPSLWVDEVLDQQLKLHLRKEYRNEAEAVARFFTGHGTAPIKTNIPTEFLAKPTTRYYPKPGSSAGRIITKQTGARRVQKDFEKLMKTLFSLGDSFNKGKRAKMPKVNISRYISKE